MSVIVFGQAENDNTHLELYAKDCSAYPHEATPALHTDRTGFASPAAQQVAQGLRGPLTIIIAPAGFGKTTLVVSCISQLKMGIAWLSLDKEDNQLWRFLRYIIATLQETNHRIGSGGRGTFSILRAGSPRNHSDQSH